MLLHTLSIVIKRDSRTNQIKEENIMFPSSQDIVMANRIFFSNLETAFYEEGFAMGNPIITSCKVCRIPLRPN
jgi:hypothetical protein